MATRFVNIDRDTPMLLPPDLRDWVPADDMVLMGFRQFLLRGLEKVTGEWDLVCLAYNMKRLWRMQYAPKKAICTG